MSNNLNLLTGVRYATHAAEDRAEQTWTAEDYLTSMRQLLAHTTSSSPEAAVIAQTATALATAALATASTPVPVKTAPASLRRDGDTL